VLVSCLFVNCCSGAFAETKKGSFSYCRGLHFVVQEREYIWVRGFHLVFGENVARFLSNMRVVLNDFVAAFGILQMCSRQCPCPLKKNGFPTVSLSLPGTV